MVMENCVSFECKKCGLKITFRPDHLEKLIEEGYAIVDKTLNKAIVECPYCKTNTEIDIKGI